jgi:multidrug efflux pump subunit AcrA (membrane-fusion protein)
MGHEVTRAVPFILAVALGGCHPSTPASPDAGTGEAGTDDASIPVQTAVVSKQTLEVLVSGPGRTDAIEQQKINAPFRGTIKRLLVVDGDHVKTGQVVATILAQNSEAAIAGAQSMLRAAKNPGEKQDAERALELARAGAVTAPLRVPESGVVVSHGASEGELVSDKQAILSIAATDSIVFVASIAQTELAKIHSGESVTVDVASNMEPLHATVHGILPSASTKDLRAPVRVDFAPPQARLQLGLFGTVHIVVDRKVDALVVPTAAVLRDDVQGTTRVAFVDASGRAHWRTVTTGITQGDKTEILSPAIEVGERVIVEGQVGLPEGASVASSP